MGDVKIKEDLMTKHLRIASIFGVVFSLIAFVRPVAAHMDGACKDDMKKLCGDVKPGDGAMQDCMKSHEADLSQGCKDNMAEMKQKMEAKRKEMQEACKADIKQFCANVTPGEGREFACLKSYEDKISAGCKAKMPKGHMGMHKDMKHHDKDGDDHDDNPPQQPAGK